MVAPASRKSTMRGIKEGKTLTLMTRREQERKEKRNEEERSIGKGKQIDACEEQ